MTTGTMPAAAPFDWLTLSRDVSSHVGDHAISIVDRIEGDDRIIDVTVEDASISQEDLDEILANHEPAPMPPPPPTVEQLVDQRICAALEGANSFAEFRAALLGA